MKSTILGILWQALGFLGAVAILYAAVQNPWNYNGITGLRGSLLGNELMAPFVLCILLFFTGVILVLYPEILKMLRAVTGRISGKGKSGK